MIDKNIKEFQKNFFAYESKKKIIVSIAINIEIYLILLFSNNFLYMQYIKK